MISWLLETLLWTGALIALVLVARRPVARLFGPQVAYALWLLPAVRLVMPAIELPAWMKGAESAPEVLATSAGPASPILDTAIIGNGAASAGPVPASSAATAAQPLAQSLPIDFALLTSAALALWLVGAAVFLTMRFAAYFRLRAELLEGAREVGTERLGRSKVRLLETNAIDAPLAFGVTDKVIALPQGFLAQPDRVSRDLALAHELEHHKGRDLLINVLVQPLFALHWFSPLAHYGWLALRRDQEAACDARVIAASEPETRPEARKVYANLIASTAAGPRLALAAPMACPVLGEKSIIHRLRSLKMSDTSTGRRWMGRTMLGAAILALPMTATISYAASDAGASAAPAPPVPPAPVVAPAAPSAPTPLTALAPPVPPALLQSSTTIIEIDPNDEDGVASEDDEVEVIIREEERRAERAEERAERAARRMEQQAERQQKMAMRIERRYKNREYGPSEAEMDEIMSEVRASMKEAHAVLDELPAIIDSAMAAAEEGQNRVMVVRSCKNDSDDVAHTYEKSDGVTVVELCKARVYTAALEGLREARESLADNEWMNSETRERVMRELDAQIRRWETHSAS